MKNTLKTIIALLIAGTFILAAVSCGNEPVNTSAEPTEAEQTTATDATTATEATTEDPNPPIVIDEHLIARWDFNEEVLGFVEDETGHGYNALVTGTPSYETVDDATVIHFTAKGQHLSVDNDDAFNFTTADSFSLVARFKWSGELCGSWPCIFNKGLFTSTNDYGYYGYWVNPTTKTLQFGTSTEPKAGCRNTPALKELDTEWHTVKMVQNGEKGKLWFYVDDVYQATINSIDAVSGTGIFIGYNGADANGTQFLGLIDYIEIYDNAIHVDEKKTPTINSMESGSYTQHSDYLDQDFTYPYKVYYPTDYKTNTTKTYPLLLFLHGHGECGTDNVKQLTIGNNYDPNLLLNEVIARDNCIVLAPQTPHGATKVKELKGFYSWEWVSIGEVWSTASRDTLPEVPAVGMIAVMNILNGFLDSGRVDLNRVYVSGLSMGGYGTWEIITRMPDVFAAAVPVCGAGFPSYAESLKNIAIWAFHGEEDKTVPVSGTKDMEEALKAVGGNIKATYFPGYGHEIWTPAYSEPGLVDWLLAQSK